MTKIFLLLISFLLLIQIWSSICDNITIYWGQNSNEANLTETCATGLYSIVVIGLIGSFGNGTIYQLNIPGHCDSSSGCTSIGSEIRYCQRQGIKVMLSIGGGLSNYSLSSQEDFKNVSDYLWNNFLGGSSSSRPLEDAMLDGIDFDIQSFSGSHYENLAINLKLLSNDRQKVYLSASPQCSFPDSHLGSALFHDLFDYVWVQFYNNPPCDYSEANPSAFFNAWDSWATTINMSKIFLGLPASQEAAFYGYVPADLLVSKVLPTVRKSPNYGGVMLWSRYEDRLSAYSMKLQLSSLCTPQSAPKCRDHDSGFEERFGYMSADSIKVYQSENLDGQCCETICWNNCSCEAYAAVNQVNNTGCQIWLEGARFTEDVGSKGQSVYILRFGRKGMPCFLTCARL